MLRASLARVLALGSFLLCCPAVWAHPGHGTTDPDSLVHQVAEPTHAVWLWAGIVGLTLLLTLAFAPQQAARMVRAVVRKPERRQDGR